MRIHDPKLRNMAHALSLSVFIAFKGTNFYMSLSLPGYLVEGFLVRNETWTLIGSQLSMGKAKVSNVD